MPFFLGSKETTALRTNFKVNNLYELLSVDLNQDDIDTLEEILEEENLHLFLQNKFGPLESPQPPRQSGYGPNSLGLKTIISARWESVRQQLHGELPSGSGYGAGNGASMWLADMYTFR